MSTSKLSPLKIFVGLVWGLCKANQGRSFSRVCLYPKWGHAWVSAAFPEYEEPVDETPPLQGQNAHISRCSSSRTLLTSCVLIPFPTHSSFCLVDLGRSQFEFVGLQGPSVWTSRVPSLCSFHLLGGFIKHDFIMSFICSLNRCQDAFFQIS